MSEDWDYNTWTTADLQSLLEEIKGILEEREENDNEVVFLYGWGQSCLDAKGMFPVSSVDEIDPSKHWVDIAKLSEDKEAYWLELVEQYGERQCK
jgi:hypothetical protein